MSSNPSHEGAGESPRPSKHPQPEPYAMLLAKIEELDGYTHVVLQQFPKAERHLLCAEIRTSINAIQRLTVVAWKRYHKKTTLQELDVEVEVLRAWIRKSLRLKYITPQRYAVWAEHVGQVGRMVGGWIKSVKAA